MKLTIFGASGRTGMQIVAQAVERGHDVTVLVRNKQKLGGIASKINVLEGDIFSNKDVSKVVNGSDAIISAIGPTKDSPAGFQPRATTHIIDAANQAGVKRLITMTGAGVRGPGDKPKFMDKMIVRVMSTFLSRILDDGYGHAEVVKASELDWTVVRAPMLTNAEGTGKYKVGAVGDGRLTTRVARADVAQFILDIAESGEYVQQMPLVAYSKRA